MDFWTNYIIIGALASFTGRFLHYLIGSPTLIAHEDGAGRIARYECIVQNDMALLAFYGNWLTFLYRRLSKWILFEMALRIPCCIYCLSTWIAALAYIYFIHEQWALMLPFLATTFIVNETLNNLQR